MKILITIVVALFLSSHASAEEEYDLTLEDICWIYKGEIRHAETGINRLALEKKRTLNEQPEDWVKKLEGQTKVMKIFEEKVLKYAKLYHYLDCADFRK